MAASQTKKNKIPSVQKLPSKQTINFAHIGETKINPILAVIGITIICVLAVLFSKYCVSDRLRSLSKARSAEQREEQRRSELLAEIDSYGDIMNEYAHYTYEGFTDAEISIVSRDAIMELIDNEVLPYGEVTAWGLSGNIVSLTISNLTLNEVSLLSTRLKEMELVSFCNVSSASTITDTELGTAVMKGDEPVVSARMTIYLRDPSKDYWEEGGEEDE